MPVAAPLAGYAPLSFAMGMKRSTKSTSHCPLMLIASTRTVSTVSVPGTVTPTYTRARSPSTSARALTEGAGGDDILLVGQIAEHILGVLPAGLADLLGSGQAEDTDRVARLNRVEIRQSQPGERRGRLTAGLDRFRQHHDAEHVVADAMPLASRPAHHRGEHIDAVAAADRQLQRQFGVEPVTGIVVDRQEAAVRVEHFHERVGADLAIGADAHDLASLAGELKRVDIARVVEPGLHALTDRQDPRVVGRLGRQQFHADDELPAGQAVVGDDADHLQTLRGQRRDEQRVAVGDALIVVGADLRAIGLQQRHDGIHSGEPIDADTDEVALGALEAELRGLVGRDDAGPDLAAVDQMVGGQGGLRFGFGLGFGRFLFGGRVGRRLGLRLLFGGRFLGRFLGRLLGGRLVFCLVLRLGRLLGLGLDLRLGRLLGLRLLLGGLCRVGRHRVGRGGCCVGLRLGRRRRRRRGLLRWLLGRLLGSDVLPGLELGLLVVAAPEAPRQQERRDQNSRLSEREEVCAWLSDVPPRLPGGFRRPPGS